MTLQEIIDALEKTDRPSREIDCAIAVALDGFYEIPENYDGAVVGYGYIRDGVRVEPGQAPDMLVPNYTYSVDAAIALCERLHPNFNWAISKISAHVFAGVYIFSGRSTTTAVAICIATLRAKFQETTNAE